jgi:hypothetical protein
MASQEFIRRNHEYVAVVRLFAEQRLPERGSEELRSLFDQIHTVCAVHSEALEPERATELAGVDVFATPAFAAMVERAGALARWPHRSGRRRRISPS